MKNIVFQTETAPGSVVDLALLLNIKAPTGMNTKVKSGPLLFEFVTQPEVVEKWHRGKSGVITVEHVEHRVICTYKRKLKDGTTRIRFRTVP